MAEIKIFTSRNCGWAIRNYATLLEKGIEFDTIPAVDGSGVKTDEFLAATPYGMTPVLMHGDTRVFESTLINEYVNDAYPHPPLLPSDPAGRITARKWIHFCESTLLAELTQIAKADGPDERQVALDDFTASMNWFAENALQKSWRGPYFFDDLFSLLDIAFFTVFETVRQLQEELDLVFPQRFSDVRTWQINIVDRPSIQEAVRIQKRIPF